MPLLTCAPRCSFSRPPARRRQYRWLSEAYPLPLAAISKWIQRHPQLEPDLCPQPESEDPSAFRLREDFESLPSFHPTSDGNASLLDASPSVTPLTSPTNVRRASDTEEMEESPNTQLFGQSLSARKKNRLKPLRTYGKQSTSARPSSSSAALNSPKQRRSVSHLLAFRELLSESAEERWEHALASEEEGPAYNALAGPSEPAPVRHPARDLDVTMSDVSHIAQGPPKRRQDRILAGPLHNLPRPPEPAQPMRIPPIPDSVAPVAEAQKQRPAGKAYRFLKPFPLAAAAVPKVRVRAPRPAEGNDGSHWDGNDASAGDISEIIEDFTATQAPPVTVLDDSARFGDQTSLILDRASGAVDDSDGNDSILDASFGGDAANPPGASDSSFIDPPEVVEVSRAPSSCGSRPAATASASAGSAADTSASELIPAEVSTTSHISIEHPPPAQPARRPAPSDAAPPDITFTAPTSPVVRLDNNVHARNTSQQQKSASVRPFVGRPTALTEGCRLSLACFLDLAIPRELSRPQSVPPSFRRLSKPVAPADPVKTFASLASGESLTNAYLAPDRRGWWALPLEFSHSVTAIGDAEDVRPSQGCVLGLDGRLESLGTHERELPPSAGRTIIWTVPRLRLLFRQIHALLRTRKWGYMDVYVSRSSPQAHQHLRTGDSGAHVRVACQASLALMLRTILGEMACKLDAAGDELEEPAFAGMPLETVGEMWLGREAAGVQLVWWDERERKPVLLA